MKKTLFILVGMLLLALICGCADDSSQTVSSQTSSLESKENGSSESTSLENPPASTPTDEVSDESTAIELPPAESSQENESSVPPAESSQESVPSTPSEEQSWEDEPQESQPEESQLEESQPEESEPQESQPQESQPEESEDEPVYDIGDAELIETGYLLYNGAAYSQTRYNATQAQRYADIYARYAELFPDINIHVINHPLSAMNITNPAVAAMVTDQGQVLDNMQSHIYGDVNFVNLKNIFRQHAGEYLYFKSDYHWTQLGAYYAYCAFAESIGVTPTPLSSFEELMVTDTFIGHTNDYAHDDRILSFVDTVYAYMPTKEHTMAVYLSDMSLYRVYNNCIQTSIKNYSCFLTGDQAFSVINVPENDQSKTVLVIKESSGNAFVPFLTEHYGNIIVIDPRHIMPDVRQVVAEYGVKDIIFFATASTSNGSTYCDYYHRLIGE